ncbi:MAG: hypothetical protein MRECE_25c015 [Mycoplasmataceae bacterium CE_OT135]|nr:MAG: hypothetical protein MRECE_25c015 [Mycoplasmataceae bacterium CE_OT135]
MNNLNYLQRDLDEKARERDKRFTRFIIFLVLWLCSGLIFVLLGFFLIPIFILTLGIGLILYWLIAIGASITFLVLWIYNLVKWIGLKNECQEIERQLRNYDITLQKINFRFCQKKKTLDNA